MMIGKHREAVVENIRIAAKEEDFYRKVEVDDPVLSAEQSKAITDRFLADRKKFSHRFKSFFVRKFANIGSSIVNRRLEIVGEELLPDLSGGAILTSNHFGPLENTLLRHLVRRHGKKRLNVVSQVTNFAMTGPIGWLMNYADTIPLSQDLRYLTKDFIAVLQELTEQKEVILIYPEQEMWFNYRKPRPLKRGAYHFAARLKAPIVSCFVEMRDTQEEENEQFYKVKYRLHILGTLYPDENLTVKACSEALCEQDYRLKKAAYERIYGKKLTYDFEKSDIAGWKA